MWYKIGKGLNIINEYSGFHNIEYDLVIRLRTDFFFTNRLTQHHIDLVLNNTILLGPHCTEKSHLGFSHASDNFIMFPWKYIAIFKNIEKYYSNVWKNYQYVSPENLLYETLKQQALNFTNSDIKLGRVYKNSCILWAPNGTTYDGYSNEIILNLTSDFDIDKDDYKQLPIKKEILIITIETEDLQNAYIYDINREGKQINSDGELVDKVSLQLNEDIQNPDNLDGRFSGLLKKFKD
jgi:hypothetical protein